MEEALVRFAFRRFGGPAGVAGGALDVQPRGCPGLDHGDGTFAGWAAKAGLRGIRGHQRGMSPSLIRINNRQKVLPASAAAFFRSVFSGVWGNNNNATRHTIQIVLRRNGWIGGAHFDGHTYGDQLLPEGFADVVDEARGVLTHRTAVDDALSSLQDAYTQARILTSIRAFRKAGR